MSKKRYLFVVSTGANEPKKAFTPFYYAAAAASLGYETYMFFLAEGPSLLKKEVLENLRTKENEEPLKKVFDLAINNGVKMLCCSTSAKVIWDMKESDLPEGVKFAGAYTLIEMASDPETLIFYF
ncbi:MAG: DsrE family protein [Thermoproteota archaeon]|jgi:predicted peroxiredoxin|nr:DsrE family protein [Thermoproteota archaeon]